MIEEAEGRSATSKMGKGAVYKEKKAEYDKVDAELKDLKQKNNKQIEQNLNTIASLEQNKLNSSVKSKTEINQADGLLARLEAMSALTAKNSSVNLASLFIFILFVLIEASPILVKLLSRRGPYDELFEKEEYEKLIEYKKQKVKAKILANNYLELLKQKDELQIESEKRNNENLVKEIEIAKDEINKIFIGRWKQSEIDAINKKLELELKVETSELIVEQQENQKTEEEIDSLQETELELQVDTENQPIDNHNKEEIYERNIDEFEKDINS